MADPILKIELDDKLYDPGAILDKTLVAAKDLNVYHAAPDKYFPNPKPFGVVKKGQPVGIVYSWLNPDPVQNRSSVWWMFWPVTPYTGDFYYAKHDEDSFDLSALRQQGVISVAEQIEEEKEKEENENKEWYEKLMDKAIPVVLTLGIGIAAVNVLGKILASGISKKRE